MSCLEWRKFRLCAIELVLAISTIFFSVLIYAYQIFKVLPWLGIVRRFFVRCNFIAMEKTWGLFQNIHTNWIQLESDKLFLLGFLIEILTFLEVSKCICMAFWNFCVGYLVGDFFVNMCKCSFILLASLFYHWPLWRKSFLKYTSEM